MTVAQLVQVIDHKAGIEGIRLVIVQAAPLLHGQLVMALVIIVVAQHRDLILAVRDEVFHQGRLSAGAAACNADDQNIVISNGFLPPFDFSPPGLPGGAVAAVQDIHLTAQNAGDGVGGEGVVGAAQNQGVQPPPVGGEELLQHIDGPAGIHLSGLHNFHQSGGWDFIDVAGNVVAVEQPGEFLLGKRHGRCHNADPAAGIPVRRQL